MRRKLAATLALAGFFALAYGGWIPAKAALAQLLIADAWTTTLSAHGSAQKPWPWADTWPVAKLTHRPLDDTGEHVRMVLAGSTGRTMAFGPGHMQRSAPIGGAGNVVIAAHRDTHFAFLQSARTGDLFELEDARGVLHRYSVYEMGVVHKDDTRVIAEEASDVLTLITCYPFDAVVPGGPLRYVVRAERAPQKQKAVESAALKAHDVDVTRRDGELARVERL